MIDKEEFIETENPGFLDEIAEISSKYAENRQLLIKKRIFDQIRASAESGYKESHIYVDGHNIIHLYHKHYISREEIEMVVGLLKEEGFGIEFIQNNNWGAGAYYKITWQ